MNYRFGGDSGQAECSCESDDSPSGIARGRIDPIRNPNPVGIETCNNLLETIGQLSGLG